MDEGFFPVKILIASFACKAPITVVAVASTPDSQQVLPDFVFGTIHSRQGDFMTEKSMHLFST
ncbi:MAG: hypothetical protein QW331_02365, partial [Candidatus Woesearchaeota archaeon]